MSLRLVLPPPGALRANDHKDPLPYYYKPLLGRVFRHRLEMGLALVPEGGRRVLEVGVGSGILVPTLTAAFAEYTGTDLVLADGLDKHVRSGCQATFRSADLLDPASLPQDTFDVIVCFSVLEHIRDCDGAARSLARALAPGGTLVTGYPMVSAVMTRAFAAIGYRGIDDDHVSAPARIHAALARVLSLRARMALPPRAPIDLALYQCAAWTKPRSAA